MMYYDKQTDRLYDDETAMEGANISIIKHWLGGDLTAANKKYKEGKKLLKDNDPNAGKEKINEAIKILEDLLEKINSVEDSLLSSVLSYLLSFNIIAIKLGDGHKYQNNYRNQIVKIISMIINRYKKTLKKSPDYMLLEEIN